MKRTLLAGLTLFPCSVGLAILLRVNIWLAAALQEEEAAEQEVCAALIPVAVCSARQLRIAQRGAQRVGWTARQLPPTCMFRRQGLAA